MSYFADNPSGSPILGMYKKPRMSMRSLAPLSKQDDGDDDLSDPYSRIMDNLDKAEHLSKVIEFIGNKMAEEISAEEEEEKEGSGESE